MAELNLLSFEVTFTVEYDTIYLGNVEKGEISEAPRL